MIGIDDYPRVKRALEQATSSRDVSKGQMKQIKGQIQEEFGCDTIQAAKEELEKLKKDEQKEGAAWNKDLQEVKGKLIALGVWEED